MEKKDDRELERERQSRIAIIGVGKFGSTLVEGIVGSGFMSAASVVLANRSEEKLEAFKGKGYLTVSSNSEAIKFARTIVLAVKPYQVLDVLREVKSSLRDDDLLISIAAGLRTTRMREVVKCKIVRAMPNLGCKFGLGVTGWFTSDELGEKEIHLVESLFGAMGMVVKTKTEDGIDKITAVAGSGIGFKFYLHEQIEKITGELLQNEVEGKVASRIAMQVLLGAAFMLKEDGRTASELREAVTSKNGTTEAGLQSFSENDLYGVLNDGVNAAYKRSQEIGESL